MAYTMRGYLMLRNVKALSLMLLIGFSSGAHANRPLKIDVFVAGSGELYAPMGRKISEFNVHRVESLKFAEDAIANKLPKDPKKAAGALKALMQKNEYQLLIQDVVEGWSTINKVLAMGINKVPAVVIDDRYVAYGVTPAQAIKHYDAHVLRYGR